MTGIQVRVALFLVAAALLDTAVRAQALSSYPSRAVRVIVPNAAGGIVDIVARAVTEPISRDWKQSFVIEFKPCANSNIGTSAVARSDPDGYAWLPDLSDVPTIAKAGY